MGVDFGAEIEGDIERLAEQAGLVRRSRPGVAGRIVAIDPDIIAERRQRATPELTDSRALMRIAPPELVPPRSANSHGLEAALLAFLQSKSAPGAAVAVERRVFLTLAEAGEFSGLPLVFLRRLISCGKLKALRTGAGWRIPRAGLERLSDTLTATEERARQLSEHELRDIEMNRQRRHGIAAGPAPCPESVGARDAGQL
jgi:excisionase family DNA binding protein